MNHYHPGRPHFWVLFLVNMLATVGLLGFIGR